jgi:hypothetical protein
MFPAMTGKGIEQAFSRTIVVTAMLAFAAAAPSCKSDPNAGLPPDQVDTDQDGFPDQTEDRNQDGMVNPGETDPTKEDTDGDGILDSDEVSTLACDPSNDRPFFVYDIPGADAMLLADAQVRERSMLRTSDNRAPGAVFLDPDRGVAAVLIGKRPAAGVATPSAQRDYERRSSIASLGQIEAQRTRAFVTAEGFDAEQASFRIRSGQMVAATDVINELASAFLSGAPLMGTLPAGQGTAGRDLTLNLLTVRREANHFVMVAAVVIAEEPSGDQLIRVEELTDGTNVARHGAFTRHVCDEFVAKEQSKADILWVVDDSGSMEDDQMAVRAAADAMEEVLSLAEVDFRLAVTRTRAQNENDPRRGRLEGDGFTADVEQFKRDIVVGADGGWEPGLQTGIMAIDRALPATAAGAAAEGEKLREDAAIVVIHMSDERDQTVECVACGGCEREESQQTFCSGGESVIDDFVSQYTQRDAVTFAIVGDLPNGCQQTGTRDDFEPGQGYVEVANATGGAFGSLCGDMRQNLEDVARAATGIASAYQLSGLPASATLRVAVGPPGQGRVIPRSRENGFDYDPINNRIVFLGDAVPNKDDEIVVAYRRWDWANNPNTPGDPCDLCEVSQFCDPEEDIAECGSPCGEVECDPSQACDYDIAECVDPGDVTPPTDPCGCDAGQVCDPSNDECVPPCEDAGCDEGEICNPNTHLCQIPDF